MKKILLASTVALMLSASPALAGDYEKDGVKGEMKAIKKMDSNNDGKLSKEEFMESSREEFQSADTDSDGTLDRQEMKKMAKSWQQKDGSASMSKSDEMGGERGRMGSNNTTGAGSY